MQKHELLVPSGNMDCLRQAVFNGCDAVYLACKNFGARKFANNFTNEEILEAIKFCHLYGVRIYVTMNTLVKNNEVDDFLEQARFLHKNGVDALIVQDFGMICLLREKFPNLEIHASTQANISSKEICKLYYDLGVKRVVFSRELSIDEIDSIDVPIEKEAFIHGALCISYSGCCLMSSMLGGRSGNRGECAGSCRMPFTLMEDDKILSHDTYLLSTKELNTSSHIKRLLDSSIYSFKIEGRMKSPLYVGFITRLYRKLIDGEEIHLSEELDSLKTIFNREFTKGRIFEEDDFHFMNTDSPNHVGLKIGKVIEVTPKKIKIQLDENYSLNQYDAIRFKNSQKGFIVNFLYDKKDNLINQTNSICYVDNKVGLVDVDDVYKTQDYLLEKEFENVSRGVEVNFTVKAKLGEKLFIEISDDVHTVSEFGEEVQKSLNSPILEEHIMKQLSKLGNTPFISNSFDIEMDDNIFIPVKELNEIRRSLVSKLMDIRESNMVEFVEKDVSFDYDNSNLSKGRSCVVYSEEQLIECINLGVNRIYVIDRELYDKYQDNSEVYLKIPRCIFSIKDALVRRSCVSDFAEYEDSVIGSYSLNVTNIYTAYYLRKIGVNTITLSVELNEEELLEFLNLYYEKFGNNSFEIFGYGRVENMIIKGNILNISENKNNYSLIDFNKRSFPVFYDGRLTHIHNYEKKNLSLELFGDKCSICFDLYGEEVNNIKNIIK